MTAEKHPRKVTWSKIESELHKLSNHQKVLMGLEQVLKQIAAERAWKKAEVASSLVEIERLINAVERRVQMLLIEAAKDDDA